MHKQMREQTTIAVNGGKKLLTGSRLVSDAHFNFFEVSLQNWHSSKSPF